MIYLPRASIHSPKCIIDVGVTPVRDSDVCCKVTAVVKICEAVGLVAHSLGLQVWRHRPIGHARGGAIDVHVVPSLRPECVAAVDESGAFAIAMSHKVEAAEEGEAIYFAFSYPSSYADCQARLAWLDSLFGLPAAVVAKEEAAEEVVGSPSKRSGAWPPASAPQLKGAVTEEQVQRFRAGLSARLPRASPL